MEVAISLIDVNKIFGSNEVLKGINLQVFKGELLCLLGPSGCGKSTLIRIIAGLETLTSGQIELFGQYANHLPASKRNVGIVFQSYALFPNLSAYENVAYGLKNNGIAKDEIASTVSKLFEMIQLSDAATRFPAQLSGGEQQRVALARALAVNPDILLLDEPLSALDAKVRLKLRKQILEIQRKLNLTTILVTHDQDEALTMADRIVVMNKARIVQIGTPEDIYDRPQNKFVADFIGSINFIETDNQNAILAMRPENIKLFKHESENTFPGIITDLEFKGSFCRLSVRVQQLDTITELLVDLPHSEIRKQQLTIGLDVYVDMPQEKLLQLAM